MDHKEALKALFSLLSISTAAQHITTTWTLPAGFYDSRRSMLTGTHKFEGLLQEKLLKNVVDTMRIQSHVMWALHQGDINAQDSNTVSGDTMSTNGIHYNQGTSVRDSNIMSSAMAAMEVAEPPVSTHAESFSPSKKRSRKESDQRTGRRGCCAVHRRD